MKNTFIKVILIVCSVVFTFKAYSQIGANALEFDGSNYVNCGTSSSLEITGSTITLEAWIKPASFGSAGCYANTIVSKEGGSTHGFGLRCGGNGLLDFYVSQGWYAPGVTSPENALKTGIWQHVAGTYDGDTIRLYVNSQLVAKAQYTVSISYTSDPLYLASSYTWGRAFDGVIDEVRVWNVCRTASQLQLNAGKTLNGNETGLVAYYKMSDGSGTTLTDNSTNGNNGSLVNTPQWITSNIPIFADGAGTANDPYEIPNAVLLNNVRNNLSGHYIQTENIDLDSADFAGDGKGWEAIGTYASPFTGTYDGQGYLIENIFINRPTTDYVGLFGCMIGTSSDNKAILRNIKIEGVDITGNKRVGALLGKVNDNHNTLIEYCYAVDGTVKGTGTTGGLVGANNGTLTGPPASNQTLLRYCFADIDVSYIGTTAGDIKIGGLVGCGQRGTIINCFALGNVNGTNGAYNADRVGGLAGCIIQGSITRSYALGSVTGSGDYIGPLTGRGAGLGATDGVFDAFYDAANWQTGFNILGTSKTSAELKTESTFTAVGWDFDNIWAIDAGKNNGYPYLLANPPSGTTPVEPDAKQFNVASGDWATASNWFPNGVPTATTHVTIPADAEITISSGTSANVLDMEVLPGATLTINSGGSLTVYGNIYIESDENGTGSFIDNGTFTLNGQAFVQKYLASSNTYGWTVASPIVQSDSSVFNGSLGAYFYNPLIPDWKKNDSTKLKNMLGYWTKFSANKTLEFNHGSLNSGNMQYTNFYRTAYLSGNFGWNFIGNPYPSAIDWDLVVALAANGGTYDDFEAATKLYPAIYISNNNGGYSSFNDSEGNPPSFDGIIPPATAFWIQVNKNDIDATDPISGAQLTLNNTVRLHETAGSKKNSSTKLRMIIDNGLYTDEALLRLKQGTDMCFDPATDTYKMLAVNEDLPQIYMLCDDEKLSINAISDDISTAVSMPLGIISNINAMHVLSFDLSLFDSPVDIYLEDTHNNSMTEISQQSSYSYQPLSTEENDRFVLHLIPTNAGINSNSNLSATSIYANNGSLYINLQEADAIVDICNIIGQEVYSAALNNGLTKLNLSLTKGNYIVSVISGNTIKTVKVFID